MSATTAVTGAGSEPLELLTAAEAARRLKVCSNTLRRAIEREAVIPDAVTIGGSVAKRSPLFLEPRLKELARLVKKTH
jgi:hypothetical protein